MSYLQVKNAELAGLSGYNCSNVSKGQIVAVYATEEEENHGLPFWIGKVSKVLPAREDSDDSKSDTDDTEPEKDMVEIEEYIQMVNSNGAPNEAYQPLLTHGKSKKGSKATVAKKTLTTIPMSQVCYVVDKLTLGKKLNAEAKKWVSYQCEVALRTKTFIVPGVAELNTKWGFKMLPL